MDDSNSLVTVSGDAAAKKLMRLAWAVHPEFTHDFFERTFAKVFEAAAPLQLCEHGFCLPAPQFNVYANDPIQTLVDSGIADDDRVTVACLDDRLHRDSVKPSSERLHRCDMAALRVRVEDVFMPGTSVLVMPDDERLIIAVHHNGDGWVSRLDRPIARMAPPPECIGHFAGPFRFLSNFQPCRVLDDRGTLHKTVEHAYQASKATNDDDYWRIASAPTPSHAKRRGRSISVDTAWANRKEEVMRRLLVQKFAPGSHLAHRLSATHPAELVEGNEWGDTFWGVCNGSGENRLGRMLMEIRAMLVNASHTRADAGESYDSTRV